ncbi:hypothetical protein BDR05DRAFT_999896 [Suillus weaverae]|nr:hypothetical protein BDR05DRAFT_999896 [Suillus weaverae]
MEMNYSNCPSHPYDIHPSLTLKAAVVHACDALFDSLVDCKIARGTDTGHARLSEYTTSKTVSHLNDAVQHFHSLQLCVYRPEGYIQKDIQDVDTTTSLFREALALRQQGRPDHTLSLYNLIRVLNWHYNKEPITVYIYEYAQLCCKLLPLCQESIQFRREAASLCPEGHSDRDVYLNNLTISLELRFNHQGNPNDLDEAISLHEEVLCLWPVGHRYRHFSLNILVICFDTRGDIDDIRRTVNLYHGALALHPPGNPRHGTTLNNLTLVLKTRYDKLYVSKDLNDPERHVNLFNSSSALCFRFTHTRKNEDIEEVINLCQESLAALSSLHPDRYFIYMQLQETYLSRYRILHDPTDLSLAVENFRLASDILLKDFLGVSARLLTGLAKLKSIDMNLPSKREPHQVRFSRTTLPDLEKFKDEFATAIRHTARMHQEEPRKKLRVLLQMVWDEINDSAPRAWIGFTSQCRKYGIHLV